MRQKHRAHLTWKPKIDCIRIACKSIFVISLTILVDSISVSMSQFAPSTRRTHPMQHRCLGAMLELLLWHLLTLPDSLKVEVISNVSWFFVFCFWCFVLFPPWSFRIPFNFCVFTLAMKIFRSFRFASHGPRFGFTPKPSSCFDNGNAHPSQALRWPCGLTRPVSPGWKLEGIG